MPQRQCRSDRLPANARGRDVPIQQAERLLQHDIARLVSLSTVLIENRRTFNSLHPPLPSRQVRDAAETACRLYSRQNAAAPEISTAFRRHLWGHRSTIFAVLHLQAHSACVLTDQNLQLSAEDLSHYTRLHNHLAMLVTVLLEKYVFDVAGLEATAMHVASLAVWLDFPAVCSRLLATCTSRQRPRSLDLARMTLSIVSFIQGLLLILQNLWIAERERVTDCGQVDSDSNGCGSHTVSTASPTGRLNLAVQLFTAFAESNILEYCVRAVMLAAEAAPSRAMFSDGTGSTQSLGFLFGVFLTKLARIIDDVMNWSREVLKSNEQETFRTAAEVIVYSRYILTGPNLQYGMAAHVIAQLVAAEGTGLYGMDQHVAKVLVSASRGPLAIRCQQPVVLEWCGLFCTLTMWMVTIEHFPSTPLRPCSIRAVNELNLRLLRMLRRCMAEHAARRGRVRPGTSSGSGSSSSPSSLQSPQRLLAIIPEDDTVVLAAEALKCMAMTCRQPPVTFKRREALPGGPALDPCCEQYWKEAVPAVHGILDYIEQGGEAGGSVSEAVVHALLPVVPDWPSGALPSASAPNLAAALAAGMLPTLDRALRVLSRHTAVSPMDLIQTFRSITRMNWLLAFAEPLQTEAFMVTGAKVLQRCLIGTCAHATSPLGAGFPAEMVDVLFDMPPLHMQKHLFRIVAELQEISAKAGCTLSEGTEPSTAVVDSVPDTTFATSSTCLANEDLETWSSLGDAAVLCVDLTCGTAEEDEGALGSMKEGGCSAGTRGGDGSGAGTSSSRPVHLTPEWLSGPSRQLLGLISRVLPRWLVTIGGVALHNDYDSGPGVRPLLLLAALTVTQWISVLVTTQSLARGQLPLPPWWPVLQEAVGGCIDLEAAAAVWRSLLLQQLDVVGLLGRMMRLLLPVGTSASDLEGEEWSHLACAINAMDAIAAEFPGSVAAGLRNDTLPRMAGDVMVQEDGDSESLSEDEGSGELDEEGTSSRRKPNVASCWTRLLILLEKLDHSSVEEVPEDCAPLVEPPEWIMGMKQTANRDMAALLLAAAVMPVVGNDGSANAVEPLRTCASPFCDQFTGASERDVKLRACGRCGQVWYCQPACQKVHWVTGHRESCVQRRSEGG